jgi:plastocyanin
MRLVRRTAFAATGLAALMGMSVPSASSATAQVSVQDFRFSPTPVVVAQGTVLTWHNNGPHSHTSTGDTPLGLWATGNIAPGATSASVTFRAAGGFTYHCSIHPSMVGAVRVPIVASPASGTTTTKFTLTLTSALAAGFTYDVQRRVGAGAWAIYRTGVTTKTATFKATAAGTYSFRSRLVRTSNGAASRWSPLKTVTVS